VAWGDLKEISMNLKFLKTAMMGFSLQLLLAMTMAHAGIITHGSLEADDATKYILDTSTGRMYTRFDAFDLSVAATKSSLGVGELYDGWTIANYDIADDFIQAALGVNTTPCDGSYVGNYNCGSMVAWVDGDFGGVSGISYDYFAYLDVSQGINFEIGLVTFRDDLNSIAKGGWTNIATLDQHSGINLLLYKDADIKHVPEPSTLAVFALGMIGLGFRRLKIKTNNNSSVY